MDLFLIYIVGVGIFAVIWAFYGLHHMKVPREGVGLIGYGAVAVSFVATLVFFVAALVR